MTRLCPVCVTLVVRVDIKSTISGRELQLHFYEVELTTKGTELYTKDTKSCPTLRRSLGTLRGHMKKAFCLGLLWVWYGQKGVSD